MGNKHDVLRVRGSSYHGHGGMTPHPQLMLRPWYGACRIECVLSSPCVEVIPTINPAPYVAMEPFWGLTKFEKNNNVSCFFATDIIH